MAAAKPERYLVQDLQQIVGNCAMWWRPHRQGYTANLNDAGVYSKAQALGIEAEAPRRARAWPLHEVMELSECHCDVQKLPARDAGDPNA